MKLQFNRNNLHDWPIVYMFGPVILSCLQSYFTYDLGKRFFNRGAGILSVLMLTIFPYSIKKDEA